MSETGPVVPNTENVTVAKIAIAWEIVRASSAASSIRNNGTSYDKTALELADLFVKVLEKLKTV